MGYHMVKKRKQNTSECCGKPKNKHKVVSVINTEGPL